MDWSSLLKENRLLKTASVHLRDAYDWTVKLPGPRIASGELVPLIPAYAYRPRQHRYAELLVLHVGGPHPKVWQGQPRGEP